MTQLITCRTPESRHSSCYLHREA